VQEAAQRPQVFVEELGMALLREDALALLPIFRRKLL
jgi:hypothetical protein